MKRILLFGAGKSASALILYLLNEAETEGWHLTVVDANAALVTEKLQNAAAGTAASFAIEDSEKRTHYISQADIVISLLPPALHILVAKDCIALKKNLLTASYADAELKKLAPEIAENNVLFLCEMGLDPGIDHMSAKQLIDAIHERGGRITSFLSHCGGLVAPESDDNPWHYKISWNPRNVVLAGKAGALYKWEGGEKQLSYPELFSEKRFTEIIGHEPLCWYPNRDSLSYMKTYDLPDCSTFLRTTLRHPDFIYGWKNIIELQLTDETPRYASEGKSLKDLFKEHLDAHRFTDWLEQRLTEQFSQTKDILTGLLNLTDLEQKATTQGLEPIEDFMLVNEAGDLNEVDIDDLKLNAATTLADRLHDSNLILKQLFYLGLDDDETTLDKGICSAADILQHALEKKLALSKEDRDMIVMKHEIAFELDNSKHKHTSTLLVKGDDVQQTAMAKTVGLPLGIAAKLILKGVITCKGLQIPILKEIYEPVLLELAQHGIKFQEEEQKQ